MSNQTNKHTPGPWRVEGTMPMRIDSAEGHVAKPLARDGMSPEQYQANARLIAEAPTLKAENERLQELNAELLEALEVTERRIQWMLNNPGSFAPMNQGALLKARAAIAKAKGEG